MGTPAMTIEYLETTWSDADGSDLPAVRIEWSEIKRMLGRPHEGTPRDDAALVAALQAAGAPAWVADAEGGIDEDGWYLYLDEATEDHALSDPNPDPPNDWEPDYNGTTPAERAEMQDRARRIK